MERAREPSRPASPIPALGRSYVDLERGTLLPPESRVARKPTSGSRRSRSPCACLRTCGAGTGLIQRRSTLSSSTAKPVTSVKTAFKSAVRLAGLGPGYPSHVATHSGDVADAEGAQIHGRQPVISECRSRSCSTPTDTITLTICRMQSRRSPCVNRPANEKRTYLVRFLVR